MYIFSIGRYQIHRNLRLACARLQFLPLGKGQVYFEVIGVKRRRQGTPRNWLARAC